MFRRKLAAQNTQYLLKLVLFVFYFEWLFNLIAKAQLIANDNSIDSSLRSMHIQTDQNLTALYQPDYSTIEMIPKIKKLIFITDKSNYSHSDQINDVNYYTSILLHIYEYNPIDKCQLHTLVKYSQNFKFSIDDLSSEVPNGNSVLASYLNNVTTIRLPRYATKYKPMVMAPAVSHVLRNAIESFNNFQNRYCLNKNSQGQIYALNFLHGRSFSFESCRNDHEEFNRVLNLIQADIDHIVRLYILANLPPETHTETERERLSTLNTIMTLSDYKQIINLWLNLNLSQQKLELFKDNYNYDNSTQSYLVKSGAVVFTESHMVKGVEFNISKYVFVADLKNNVGYFTYGMIGNQSPLNLQLDLLTNLLIGITEVLEAYEPAQYPDEMSAKADEILASFTKPVTHKGKITSLRGWLFPKLTAHEMSRESDEFSACMQRQGFVSKTY